jgi:hypothetical protein
LLTGQNLTLESDWGFPLDSACARGHANRLSLSVGAADVDCLHSPVKDRNAPQKHVWRARIVLLSAKGLGTTGIMRAIGKSRP